MVNKDIMTKALNYSFDIGGDKEGYMLRCFLQTADDYRDEVYTDLSDAEFEALKRVYRFCIQSPVVINRWSYAVTFITKSAADMVKDQAYNEIINATCANDIFPMFHMKTSVEPWDESALPEENSEENSEESSEENSEDFDRDAHEQREHWEMGRADAFDDLVEELEGWDYDFTSEEKLKLIEIILDN